MTRKEYLASVTKETPERYCVFCGKKLERKHFTNRSEDLSAFKARKYCNRECKIGRAHV